ncbi:hypothetical protein CLV86_1308 [Lacinutrix venerupis]|uniref:Uncharacterized protein n=1 Tax=Lacinutrix venerupis TaxID=1486034 RepID=A0AAC9LMD5_9FLAO|nr:hypothetical protein [Lacinutrix venerupis]APX99341.1 hypothetical protein BWR22_03135 [Lacinutrix venerupis]RLJ65729.1 hypothetical protein CLV86_1308 [Lacinutrix venerupis]
MSNKPVVKYLILGILFFLPVAFLLLLYPSTNNYNVLDVVKEDVLDISNLSSVANSDVVLKDHITVLGFLGSDPESKIIEASNLKELIYNKFKGFKNFQIVMMVTLDSHDRTSRLIQELNKYSEHKYWHFVAATDSDINKLFNSLRTSLQLDNTLATNSVFVIDKELNQRGRLDDRTKKEKEKETQVYPLTAYDCSKVSIIKNKLAAEDMRVLLEEYRKSGRNKIDSSNRRAKDLNPDNKTDEKE